MFLAANRPNLRTGCAHNNLVECSLRTHDLQRVVERVPGEAPCLIATNIAVCAGGRMVEATPGGGQRPVLGQQCLVHDGTLGDVEGLCQASVLGDRGHLGA